MDAEKEQLSMPCKLVCSAILNRLASDNIYSFDEVQSQQWGASCAWVQDATKAVQDKIWEFKPRWRNPDVVGSKDGFKEQPQIAFPEQLLGILLAPRNRAGQRYCAEFQNGSCVNGDSCHLGLHKCAAVLVGGLATGTTQAPNAGIIGSSLSSKAQTSKELCEAKQRQLSP